MSCTAPARLPRPQSSVDQALGQLLANEIHQRLDSGQILDLFHLRILRQRVRVKVRCQFSQFGDSISRDRAILYVARIRAEQRIRQELVTGDLHREGFFQPEENVQKVIITTLGLGEFGIFIFSYSKL